MLYYRTIKYIKKLGNNLVQIEVDKSQLRKNKKYKIREKCICNKLHNLKKMQAVILCGGKGIRLRPLTKKVPKPMLIINKKPFLEYQILYLKSKNIKNFVFCVGYLWKSIMDYFEDGSRLNVNISYSIEKELLGTGGALKLAEDLLKTNFFVINGDSYLPINYKVVYHQAKKINKLGVLVVYNNKKDTYVKNNIALDKNGLIIKYDKANLDNSMGYVDAGVMVLKKKALDLISLNKRISLENNLFKRLINMKQLASIKTNQRFYDIGTPQRLKEVGKVLK